MNLLISSLHKIFLNLQKKLSHLTSPSDSLDSLFLSTMGFGGNAASLEMTETIRCFYESLIICKESIF